MDSLCKIIVILACLGGFAVAEGAERVKFNRDVLPILADKCLTCHGVDSAKRKAGLRLDVRTGSTAELASGVKAIVPGDLSQSELWTRITSVEDQERMPPPQTGLTLTEAQRETLKRWIEQGAEYEPHWAYVPPQQVEPAAVSGVEQPIDRFIRARLLAENISPAPEADRATLIRRVTLDLTGLPPSPLEVDAFVNDGRPDAFERVVERLLGSEHFGERWARWWLDLAHYGDSDGYLQDFLRPVAWRYRQWVVDAFNQDLPFDQFTIQQLAGDLLPNATVSQKMGTGFLRNTLSNREGGADLEEYRVNQVLDRTMSVGTTWLAMTVGCAQCHDHKFDAVSQREFYQLYAIFNNADEANLSAPLADERPLSPAERQEYDRKRAELVSAAGEPLKQFQADWEKQILHTETHPGEDFTWDRSLELLGLQWGQSLGEGQLEGLNIIKIPAEKRTQDQKDRLLDYLLQAPPAAWTKRFADLKLGELKTKLDALTKTLPTVTRAPGMMHSTAWRTTHIHQRGDFHRPGDEVHAGVPSSLPELKIGNDPERLAFAKWLVSPGHPLTARVTVNRLWQELFGRGLVGTSENFGVRGDRPSHPELLDWLAVQLQKDGWSVKSLLRRIVLSQTYRQSSAARPELAVIDPLNKLVARQSRLRLSGEAVRDSALAVSGLLNRTIGGPSVKPPQPASVSKEGYSNIWIVSPGAERYRRGLYTFIQRTSPFAQFVTFDMPDASRSCTRRERSNTPMQALALLNDPAFLDAARALASRIEREDRGTDETRIQHAFHVVLSRSPKAEESQRMLAYLYEQRDLLKDDAASTNELLGPDAKLTDAAWVAVASILLNLDEFINRE